MMGKSPSRKLSADEKAALHQAMRSLGSDPDRFVLTHNKDAKEFAREVVYRAWCVWVHIEGGPAKGTPINWNRHLPGGATVGAILTAARRTLIMPRVRAICIGCDWHLATCTSLVESGLKLDRAEAEVLVGEAFDAVAPVVDGEDVCDGDYSYQY